MAKRRAGGGTRKQQQARKTSDARRLATRPRQIKPSRAASLTRNAASGPVGKRLAASAHQPTKPIGRPRDHASTKTKPTRLRSVRRSPEDTVPTPPSSLNLNRRGSAVRTGRAELAQSLQDHATMSPGITGGDVDADLETAYFSGDEAPGGDNPTPDQEVVDDIAKAIGVEYQDNEELRSSDKIVERDKHRWELDPASSEDYKDRK